MRTKQPGGFSESQNQCKQVDTYAPPLLEWAKLNRAKMITAKISALLFLVLCYQTASSAAAAKADWRTEWDKTVAAAEKEGIVSLYIFENGPLTEEAVHGESRPRNRPGVRVRSRWQQRIDLDGESRRASPGHRVLLDRGKLAAS